MNFFPRPSAWSDVSTTRQDADSETLKSLASDVAGMKGTLDALSTKLEKLDAIESMLQTMADASVTVMAPRKRGSVSIAAPGGMGLQNGAGLGGRQKSCSRRSRAAPSISVCSLSETSAGLAEASVSATVEDGGDEFAADYTMLNAMLDNLRSQGKQSGKAEGRKRTGRGSGGRKACAYGVDDRAKARNNSVITPHYEHGTTHWEKKRAGAMSALIGAVDYLPMFHPESTKIVCWNMIIMLFVVTSAIVVPLQVVTARLACRTRLFS
jgi:hypothetical protein